MSHAEGAHLGQRGNRLAWFFLILVFAIGVAAAAYCGAVTGGAIGAIDWPNYEGAAAEGNASEAPSLAGSVIGGGVGIAVGAGLMWLFCRYVLVPVLYRDRGQRSP